MSAIVAGTDVVTVSGKVIQPDLADGLYFGIVKFTTLGYGNFVPRDGYRLTSALQALYGYLFLGGLVGLVVGTVVNRQKDGLQKTAMYVAATALVKPVPKRIATIKSAVEACFVDHVPESRR